MTPKDTIDNFFIDDFAGVTEHESEVQISLTSPLSEQVTKLERAYLKTALQHYRGSIQLVVKHSGLNPRTLYRKMKRYNLNKQDFR